MENQESTQIPAAATEEAAATKDGGNATQEVSSSTQAVEPTKRSLRVEKWRYIYDHRICVHLRAIFNRIPCFIANRKAAALLIETDEFKNATEIEVQGDRALNAAKQQTILAGKNLYLPGHRDTNALCLHLKVPADSTQELIRDVINRHKDFAEYRIEIPLEKKVELDMIIIGSVIVSRDGYRIGRGNGFNDLDVGLLIEVGAITDKTIIATMVHDCQVVDSLPKNLFQKYDTPVDMIITPTEVIRVAERLPRPSGVYWELLSERRLKIKPALQVLKENLEKSGKIIVLKEVDTDVEQNPSSRTRNYVPRRRVAGNRRFPRRAVSQNNPERQQGGEDNNGQPQRKRMKQNKRRLMNNRRRPTRSEGDQSGAESKSQVRKSDGGNKPARKNRREFSIKVYNISRDLRIRDLKKELSNRQCKPISITWRPQFRRCYLHYGNPGGQPYSEEEMNKVVETLENLSITIASLNKSAKAAAKSATDGEEANNDVKPTRVVNLKVELIKYKKSNDNNNATSVNSEADSVVNGNGDGDPAAGGDVSSTRIESVDTTTV